MAGTTWKGQANERLERFTTFAAVLLEPFPDHYYERRQTHAMLARYVLALGVDGTLNGNTFEEFGELVETAHVTGRITSDTYDAILEFLEHGIDGVLGHHRGVERRWLGEVV